MMGHREKLVGGDEYDALTRWKKFVGWRAGERQWIKRKFNKRQRKLWRATIEKENVNEC